MKDINKRLVEVEYILKKLNIEYTNKIPQEIWNYIEENKDKSYVFNYDTSKTLAEQNLNIYTIAILTYINMEYLLNKEQKRTIEELLKKDEVIAEEAKKEKYKNEDIFKNRTSKIQEKEIVKPQMIEYKESTLKKIWNKILSFFHLNN